MRAKRPAVCEHQLFVFTDSIALAGAIFLASTRIRDHPRNGVVDANYKVHSVQNLFIAGSSVFLTCSYANPPGPSSLIALRLAEHLQKQPR